jgi:hypothetical protein
MALRVPSAFVVRPLGLVVVVLLLAGCKHHQSAMRPVYVESAPVAAAPCAPGTPGCTPATTTVTPGFEDAGSGLSTPEAPKSAPGSGSTEPQLNLSPKDEDPNLQPAPPNTSTSPPQGARRPSGGLSSGSGRVTMKSRVEPFVNDPNDLFQPPKADRPWKYIVLHHSAHAQGSYAQIDQEHRKNLGTTGCGYHFVIGNGSESPDGQIEVAKRWSDQKAGAHCRDARTPEMNDYGIGICLVGNLDQAAPTARQIESARALVEYLRTRYAIPADHVGTHTTLASHPTVCPGKNFPAQAILAVRYVPNVPSDRRSH